MDEWKTWDEWGADGYHVLLGSKATKIDGVAKFSKSQVGNTMSRRDYDNERSDENPYGMEPEGHWGGDDTIF